MADLEQTAEPLLSDTPPQRKRDIVRKNLEDWWGAHATSLYALLSHVALCFLFGYAMAVCLSSFGKLVLILVILIFVLVQALAWKGYVNLNWHQIGRAFKSGLDLDNDGRLGLGDLKQGAKHLWNVVGGYGIPSIAAVALGFYAGM